MTTEDIKSALIDYYGKDNREHSIAEFKKEMAKIGIKGYTPGQLSGAISQLYAKEELVKTGRGIYRRNSEKSNMETWVASDEKHSEWREKIGMRISDMEKDMSDIIKEVNLLEISESDFDLLREIKQDMQMLKKLKQKCINID